MNKPNFRVGITNYIVIHEIEDGWKLTDYQQLLSELDYSPDDANSLAETRELCLMCLQDRPKEEAAEIVLTHRFSERLTKGQIRNAAIELSDEKLWEQFADLSLHEELFHVGSLMFAAFPKDYYEPEAVRLTVQIQAKNESATALLENALDESLLVRLLADGMDEHSILHRLFEDQLVGNSFPDAKSVVWIVGIPNNDGNSQTIEITSSAHWFDALKDVEVYESHAEPDIKHVDG